ncbi:K Homology type 1 [Chlorella sorokiniana]|uniref:K Homology type 1 n=1 Tax=Chlorella sorokiniana TaxID=3076 RepID=A0A2P6TWU4_CHLSO|nr:K Homology type 1 [Chlorella sorokiniana]|eukprot:PRW58517.1 K Homology type 1 [Chlorella sorokiniana]
MNTVAEALALLQRSKAAAASSLRQAKAAALAQLQQSQHRLSPRHTPSGPRRRNEGIDDEEQGIVEASASATGATVTLSLLAAGFVVGPGGASVRAICASTGADIRSYTDSQGGRRVRIFVLEVDREQVVGGITFFYSPPPRAAVPYAAALKATHESPSVPSKPAGLFSPRTAGKENSSGSSAATAALLLAAATAQAAPLQDHQTLSLLATPSAPARTRSSLPSLAPPLPPFGQLSRTSSGAMPMEADDVASTPAYSTTPPSYSLFSGGGLGGAAALFGQPDAFGSGGSVFRSALETPTAPPAAAGASLFCTPSAAFLAPPGSGLSAAEATPDIASASAHLLRAGSGAFEARLLRAGSCGEDALLAAAAAASFHSFPAAAFPTSQAPAFPTAGPLLPPPPQPSPLMAPNPLALLPLGAVPGPTAASAWPGASGPSIWGLPMF